MEQKPEHQEHEQKELEKKNYSFIREIVKKKPLDKRGLLRKILSLAGAAVLAGVVASFVFVWMVPVAERMVNGDSSRVSFPEDEEETSTSSQSVIDSSQPAQETPCPRHSRRSDLRSTGSCTRICWLWRRNPNGRW